jgi:hypothetical protein
VVKTGYIVSAVITANIGKGNAQATKKNVYKIK